jgi:hypothetical protein
LTSAFDLLLKFVILSSPHTFVAAPTFDDSDAEDGDDDL